MPIKIELTISLDADREAEERFLIAASDQSQFVYLDLVRKFPGMVMTQTTTDGVDQRSPDGASQ